jgi:hypothetical protein
MIDAILQTIGTAADTIAHVLSVIPMQAWAMLLGLAASALITQRAKFWIPIEWNPMLRTFLCQTIAFVVAVVVVWLIWPSVVGFVAAVCIGIASPTLYAITVRLIGMRWPALRDLLSQDTRP